MMFAACIALVEQCSNKSMNGLAISSLVDTVGIPGRHYKTRYLYRLNLI